MERPTARNDHGGPALLDLSHRHRPMGHCGGASVRQNSMLHYGRQVLNRRDVVKLLKLIPRHARCPRCIERECSTRNGRSPSLPEAVSPGQQGASDSGATALSCSADLRAWATFTALTQGI